MKPFLLALITITAGTWLLSGCTDHAHAGAPEPDHHQHDEHHHDEHDEHGHGEADGPAKYEAGLGLLITPETYEALGVETATVAMRPIRSRSTVTASVFDAGPPVRASAFVPINVADELERRPPAEVTLLAVHRDLTTALTQAEIVLALPGSPIVGSMVNLTLSGSPHPALAIPNAAVLHSATGTFVYVVNGPHLLRTAVQTGATDDSHVEILSGLAPGNTVAAKAVKQLWLTELRLTKGGGHSH